MAFIIAIDGPAGAGKSSVSRRAARAVGLTYIDTGAMYRAVAYKARKANITSMENETLSELVSKLTINFSMLNDQFEQRTLVNNEDVTKEIRTPEISQLTSTISALPDIRRAIVTMQRKMAAEYTNGALLEGRDIGTVVFPCADLKIFLTASPEVRAKRRFDELLKSGLNPKFEEVLFEQTERDARDSSRIDSPLKAAEDSVIINTDGMEIDQVVQEIVQLANQRKSAAGV